MCITFFDHYYVRYAVTFCHVTPLDKATAHDAKVAGKLPKYIIIGVIKGRYIKACAVHVLRCAVTKPACFPPPPLPLAPLPLLIATAAPSIAAEPPAIAVAVNCR